MADLTDPSIGEGLWSEIPFQLDIYRGYLSSIGATFPFCCNVVCYEQRSDFLRLAYLEVRDDKSETNWLLLDYESEKSDKLKLTKTGTGGLSELKEALVDSRASYGYVRVSYSNDKESTREKFILVVRLLKPILLDSHHLSTHDTSVPYSCLIGVDWVQL
jgi:hypothetical protein